MATLTGVSSTLWQRSLWWVERITSRGGDVAVLGIGTLLLSLGIAFYIGTAARFAEGQKYLNKLERQRRLLATEQLHYMAEVEQLRSPERLTRLAKTYRMVPPSPKTVWRLP